MTGRGVGRNVVVAVVGNAFAPLAALATAPIMAHGLGVDGRGDVAAATAPLILATTVATFGLPAAVTYFVARHPGLIRGLAARGVVLTLLAGALASAAVALLSGVLSSGDPGLGRLISLAGLAIAPTLIVSVLQSVAAGTHRWHLVTTERLVTASVRLVAFLFLLVTNLLTVESSVLVLALSPVVGGSAYVRLLARPSILEADDGLVVGSGELLHYGTRVWVGSITGVLLSRLDQTLLLPLGGSYDLGLYVVAVTVGELPLVIVNAVRDVMFSADASDDASVDAGAPGSKAVPVRVGAVGARDDRLGVASRLSTVVALGVSLLVGGTLAWWLPVVFGAEFSAAIPVCLVLLAAVVVGNPGSLAGVALSARGRPGLRSLSLLTACVVNIAALIALVPLWGALGAAVATLLGNLVAGTACVVLLRRASAVPARTFYGLRRGDLEVVGALSGRLLRRD